jgi:type IV pilus assembly protein PilC
VATFAYTARTLEGTSVSGTIPAENERAALAALDRMSLFPVELSDELTQGTPAETQGDGLEALVRNALRRRIGAETAARYALQLADLSQAGVPILKALDTVSEDPTGDLKVVWGAKDGTDDQRARAVLRDVRRDVAQGASLADALSRRPELFQPTAISMVRAGEEGGYLDVALRRVATFAERENDLRRRLKGALAYPAVLCTLSVGAIVFLLTWVVPRFAVIYGDLGGALPLPTRILMATGNALTGYGWLLALAIVAGGLGLTRYLSTQEGRRRKDTLLLRLPLVRAIVAQASIARFATTLGTLLASGVPILRALEIATEASGNLEFASLLGGTLAPVREGASLAQPLSRTRLFPPQVIEMIEVGQESGTLVDVLDQIGRRADAEVDHALKLFVTVLEPALIVAVAAVVFFVVLAALLPIFELNTMIN